MRLRTLLRALREWLRWVRRHPGESLVLLLVAIALVVIATYVFSAGSLVLGHPGGAAVDLDGPLRVE